jgi:hypothetical protein
VVLIMPTTGAPHDADGVLSPHTATYDAAKAAAAHASFSPAARLLASGDAAG